MTQDEIYEMARQASTEDETTRSDKKITLYAAKTKNFLERFAKLVAAKAFEEGFFAGFSASGEGFNGEYPYGDKGIDIKTDQWVLNELKEARGEA